MCLGIPAKIVEIDGTRAIVDMAGVRREADVTLTPGVAVGDYILLHAGYAIQTYDEEDAQETLALIREMISAADR